MSGLLEVEVNGWMARGEMRSLYRPQYFGDRRDPFEYCILVFKL